MTSSDDRTVGHLINLILTRNGDTPNFSLLLGSGSSSTSGIRTAQEMIEEWRSLLFQQSNYAGRYSEWLSEQYWFNHDDEYSILFETIYDQPSQRRIHVEECVKDAHPGWGYVYLTNFLANRLFDVVLTTNFDDLINEACYLYSDGLRPIVAAHDSAIEGIRVTSARPKIIKLHGDFLYDNIKNTLAELETLETNTKRKLRQFAQEYGLVVIGYSGRDRSVMDTLDLLLRDDEHYRQGVYWCHRRGAPKSNRLLSLLRRDRVYLVEVDGFDELTADLHKAAGLTLPKPIATPFDMARDRARLFVEVEEPLRSHPVIGAHVREVLASIGTHSPTIPLAVEASILSQMGEFGDSIIKWRQAYEENPTDGSIAYHYADDLANAGMQEELVEFVRKAPLNLHNKTYFLLRADKNEEVIELATQILDRPGMIMNSGNEYNSITRINRAIALKRLGRYEKMLNDLEFLEQAENPLHPNIKAGIAALRGDRANMFAALNGALGKTLSPKYLREFPVFEDYQEDPEFLKLLT